MCKNVGRVTNSVDPDQTPRSVASDLGLHCSIRPVFPNILCKYGNMIKLILRLIRVCTFVGQIGILIFDLHLIFQEVDFLPVSFTTPHTVQIIVVIQYSVSNYIYRFNEIACLNVSALHIQLMISDNF